LQHSTRSTYKVRDGQVMPQTRSLPGICPPPSAVDGSEDAWEPFRDMSWLRRFLSDKCGVPEDDIGDAVMIFWDSYMQRARPHANIAHFTQGSRFAVSKERIHQRPLAFYQGLLDLVDSDFDPCLGYMMEWFWWYIVGVPENAPCSITDEEPSLYVGARQLSGRKGASGKLPESEESQSPEFEESLGASGNPGGSDEIAFGDFYGYEAQVATWPCTDEGNNCWATGEPMTCESGWDVVNLPRCPHDPEVKSCEYVCKWDQSCLPDRWVKFGCHMFTLGSGMCNGAKLPRVVNVLEDDCTVHVGAGMYNRTCSKYCEAQGLSCEDGYHEGVSLACHHVHVWSDDAICQCGAPIGSSSAKAASPDIMKGRIAKSCLNAWDDFTACEMAHGEWDERWDLFRQQIARQVPEKKCILVRQDLAERVNAASCSTG